MTLKASIQAYELRLATLQARNATRLDPKRKQFLKPLIEEAARLGEAAFEAGKKPVPAMDRGLGRLLEKHRGEMQFGESLPLLEAWSDAWTRANLRAPVNG